MELENFSLGPDARYKGKGDGVGNRGERKQVKTVGVGNKGERGSEFITSGFLTLATLTGVGQLAAICP